jgi:anti-sigma-K factor RskA
VQQGDVVAVSVEPSGGSAQPTTTPVVTLRA